VLLVQLQGAESQGQLHQTSESVLNAEPDELLALFVAVPDLHQQQAVDQSSRVEYEQEITQIGINQLNVLWARICH